MAEEPKTRAVIFTRRGLYFCVPFATAFGAFLQGAESMDARTVTAALFVAFAAGGAALLAAIEKTEPVKPAAEKKDSALNQMAEMAGLKNFEKKFEVNKVE